MKTSTSRRAKARHGVGLYQSIRKSGIAPDAAYVLDANIRETVGSEVDILRREMKEALAHTEERLMLRLDALEHRLLVRLLAGVAALLTVAGLIISGVTYLLR